MNKQKDRCSECLEIIDTPEEMQVKKAERDHSMWLAEIQGAAWQFLGYYVKKLHKLEAPTLSELTRKEIVNTEILEQCFIDGEAYVDAKNHFTEARKPRLAARIAEIRKKHGLDQD